MLIDLKWTNPSDPNAVLDDLPGNLRTMAAANSTMKVEITAKTALLLAARLDQARINGSSAPSVSDGDNDARQALRELENKAVDMLRASIRHNINAVLFFLLALTLCALTLLIVVSA